MNFHCHLVDKNTTEGHSPCAIFNYFTLCQLRDDQGGWKGAENGGMLAHSAPFQAPINTD